MPLPIPPTRLLNKKYRVGQTIGKGATALVYKAANIDTGEIVALKQMPIDEYNKSSDSPVQREIKLLCSLQHPNIIRYVESFTEDGDAEGFFIALEYAESGSLSSMINKFGPLPEPLAAKCLHGVLLGLSYLHKQGIVHRDIKGANVLMDKGVVKLADFGIATTSRGASGEGDGGCEYCGTPYYMAPECIVGNGGASGAKCDIWSFGCLVVELLTGHPPHYKLNPNAALYATAQGETDIPPVRTSATEGDGEGEVKYNPVDVAAAEASIFGGGLGKKNIEEGRGKDRAVFVFEKIFCVWSETENFDTCR